MNLGTTSTFSNIAFFWNNQLKVTWKLCFLGMPQGQMSQNIPCSFTSTILGRLAIQYMLPWTPPLKVHEWELELIRGEPL